MDKYKNGKIYTIRYKNDDSLIYVGSTVQPLYKRLAAHKARSKNQKYNKTLLYIKMNETDINDWYIELFEDCPSERKEQLLQCEGQVIREIATLNKQISGRTKQEYYEDNKEQIQEKMKEWREDNKEKKKECDKNYREAHKEQIQEYRKEHYEDNKEQILEKQKEYYEDNKEQIKEKIKEYKEVNKEKINAYKSELVFCECGCSTRRDSIAAHKRTNKHLDIMKELAKTLEQTI
jgi:gas vesicle protein